MKPLDNETKKAIFEFQKNEITGHLLYKYLTKSVKGKNAAILSYISKDELNHYNTWKKYTDIPVFPDKINIWKYMLLFRLFGLTFAIKLMEKEEKNDQEKYKSVLEKIPETKRIIEDENRHEKSIITMISEERIKYVSSVVLGLNDALIELTGAMTGLTLTLQSSSLVGIAGLLIGIPAALSMMFSEYLSKELECSKEPEYSNNPGKAAIYTGIAYMFTVLLLILPYFILNQSLASLAAMLFNAILIISIFSYFVSVIKEVSFKKRFQKMLSISLGVVAITFVIGLIIKQIIA